MKVKLSRTNSHLIGLRILALCAVFNLFGCGDAGINQQPNPNQHQTELEERLSAIGITITDSVRYVSWNRDERSVELDYSNFLDATRVHALDHSQIDLAIIKQPEEKLDRAIVLLDEYTQLGTDLKHTVARKVLNKFKNWKGRLSSGLIAKDLKTLGSDMEELEELGLTLTSSPPYVQFPADFLFSDDNKESRKIAFALGRASQKLQNLEKNIVFLDRESSGELLSRSAAMEWGGRALLEATLLVRLRIAEQLLAEQGIKLVYYSPTFSLRNTGLIEKLAPRQFAIPASPLVWNIVILEGATHPPDGQIVREIIRELETEFKKLDPRLRKAFPALYSELKALTNHMQSLTEGSLEGRDVRQALKEFMIEQSLTNLANERAKIQPSWLSGNRSTWLGRSTFSTRDQELEDLVSAYGTEYSELVEWYLLARLELEFSKRWAPSRDTFALNSLLSRVAAVGLKWENDSTAEEHVFDRLPLAIERVSPPK
ncbi:MAG: hypothetical protein H6617_05090 [Bdellovibrionaceae bacterium]|nr:hypothetical protein [Bdellovibrionales bacterium]MCB9254039.1 hypothetical protein [Pseudobdellovibrionaceae bacterium]